MSSAQWAGCLPTMSWTSCSRPDGRKRKRDHAGCDVVRLEKKYGPPLNDSAFISAIAHFCELKGYSDFNISNDGKFVHIKNFPSSTAAEDVRLPCTFMMMADDALHVALHVRRSGRGGYAAGSSPAVAACHSFARSNHEGGDVMKIEITGTHICGNDPSFISAIQHFCEAKGYNAFNIHENGSVMHIKQFGSGIRLHSDTHYNFYAMPDVCLRMLKGESLAVFIRSMKRQDRQKFEQEINKVIRDAIAPEVRQLLEYSNVAPDTIFELVMENACDEHFATQLFHNKFPT